MQIEQIQYTVDVHHLGSFTKAAEKTILLFQLLVFPLSA